MNWINRTRGKYGAKKAERDGLTLGSKLEAAVYDLLKVRQASGELTIVQSQDHVYLTKARIAYVPDFKCIDTRTKEYFWVEAKGFETQRWPTIKKLWRHYGPGRLEIWKGTWARPKLDEVIIPEGVTE